MTDSIVNAVIQKFLQRSELGQKKYGTTLDRTDLKPLDWIQHAQEEFMDGILYMEKLKRVLSGGQNIVIDDAPLSSSSSSSPSEDDGETESGSDNFPVHPISSLDHIRQDCIIIGGKKRPRPEGGTDVEPDTKRKNCDISVSTELRASPADSIRSVSSPSDITATKQCMQHARTCGEELR